MMRISSGVIVWALHFATLYGFAALACARSFAGLVPWVAAAATLAALAAMIIIVATNFSRRGDFTGWLTLSVAALALTAIAFETVPLFIVTPCA